MNTKKLVEKLKEKGLDIGEEAAALLVDVTLDWAAEECLASSNVLVKAAGGLLPAIKPALMSAVDKIDGQDDAGR